jgi:hypothetical protein
MTQKVGCLGLPVMPQPLSRVASNGVFYPDLNVLNDKPELSTLVAAIFAAWTHVEHYLGLIVVRVLGADAAPALAMFSTLTAQRLQMGALEAAAEATLCSDEFDVFKACLNATDAAQTPRNHLAHWFWGGCVQIPDALLLADPKMLRQHDREMQKLLFDSDTKGVNLADMAKVASPNPDDVLVYKKGDLERARRDLIEAADIALGLTIYLDPIFTGKRPAKADAKPPAEIRDQLFQQLNSRRLFRERFVGGSAK